MFFQNLCFYKNFLKKEFLQNNSIERISLYQIRGKTQYKF